MTIEESIQNAIRSLGINGLDSDVSIKPTKPDNKPKHKEEVKPEKPPAPVVMNPPEEEPEEDQTHVVFCKIKGDTMALLFPKDEFEFGETMLGDITLSTLTCKIPNLSTHRLQELEVITEEKPVEPKKQVSKPESKKPLVEKPKPEKEYKSDKSDGVESDRDRLMEEKAQVDREIKAARSSGDTEEVERLRKVRRNIRKQINSL